MASTEIEHAAGGFCYLDAAVTGASGLVALTVGPRLSGLTKVAGAATLAWAGIEPDRQRLQIATGVNVGLAVVDLLSAFRPQLAPRQRVFRLAGAALNTLFAVLHHEASRDI